jgi:hypothetical protein
VYTAHQYEPFEYTTQPPYAGISYPGSMDLDYDGDAEPFNRAWLDRYLAAFDRFRQQHNVPVASNEYGVKRWAPGAARFLSDEMTLLEQRRMNYALWVWSGSWAPITAFDDFDFLHGPDPENHQDVASSRLITTIRRFWLRNRLRPSNVVFSDLTGPALPLCCDPVEAGPNTPSIPSRPSRFPLPRTGAGERTP